MKRNRIIIISVVVLSIIALYLYFSSTKGTIKKELRDFAVEDTASITKVFLVDKRNMTVSLEKKNRKWYVNDKHLARLDLVQILLKTIKRVDVKAPVANAAMKNIITSLAAKSTKVEIYSGEELLKTYYVGGPTPDQHGTYMLLENSSRPFVMNIPGFRGYLTTRFITDEYQWRSQAIFNNNYNEIKSVTVKNYEKPENSFKLTNNQQNTYSLFSLTNNNEVSNYDTVEVKKFFSRFRHINFDKFLVNTAEDKLDSLLNINPYYEISLEDFNKKSTSITIYKRPNYEEIQDDDGELYNFDVDNLYGLINNKSELVLIQYYVFDQLFKDIQDFTKTN